jgi:aryl-alcohol dehydrogenase-like predicted oxidoreductase
MELTATPDARASGYFSIGDSKLVRLGFGAMRLTGPGIWGEPQDRAQALRVLRRLPDLGINFIDTADSYGPFVSEDLIAEALHPYDGMFIATKGGLTRQGPTSWLPLGRPEYLRQCVLMSLRRLKLDPKVPRADQFGVIADMIKEGLIRYAGVSQVSVREIKIARAYFPVATVQNKYNLADRADDDVIDFCTKHGIGFIPWYPLAAGELAKPGGAIDRVARAHGATPSQVALAWALKRSPVMLPIPGTSQVAHLEENVAAASLQLCEHELSMLSAVKLSA